MKEIDKHIQKMRGDISEMNEKIRNCKHKLHDLLLKRIEKEWGIKEGVTVIYKDKEYKVTHIEPDHYGRPWLKGVTRKKNGDWSKREQHLFGDWRVE